MPFRCVAAGVSALPPYPPHSAVEASADERGDGCRERGQDAVTARLPWLCDDCEDHYLSFDATGTLTTAPLNQTKTAPWGGCRAVSGELAAHGAGCAAGETSPTHPGPTWSIEGGRKTWLCEPVR